MFESLLNFDPKGEETGTKSVVPDVSPRKEIVPLTHSRRGFLRRIRARMRVAWFAATAQRHAPVLGLALIAVLVVDWLTKFDMGLQLAGALLATYLLCLAVASLFLRISEWDASRAAER